MTTKRLTERQRRGFARLLLRIANWTHARWDQWLRDEIGDPDADEVIKWIEDSGIDVQAEGQRRYNDPLPPSYLGCRHVETKWSRVDPQRPERAIRDPWPGYAVRIPYVRRVDCVACGAYCWERKDGSRTHWDWPPLEDRGAYPKQAIENVLRPAEERVGFYDPPQGATAWQKIDETTAFAPPFGTIHQCDGCGALVGGGPSRCVRCANEPKPEALPINEVSVTETDVTKVDPFVRSMTRSDVIVEMLDVARAWFEELPTDRDENRVITIERYRDLLRAIRKLEK